MISDMVGSIRSGAIGPQERKNGFEAHQISPFSTCSNHVRFDGQIDTASDSRASAAAD